MRTGPSGGYRSEGKRFRKALARGGQSMEGPASSGRVISWIGLPRRREERGDLDFGQSEEIGRGKMVLVVLPALGIAAVAGGVAAVAVLRRGSAEGRCVDEGVGARAVVMRVCGVRGEVHVHRVEHGLRRTGPQGPRIGQRLEAVGTYTRQGRRPATRNDVFHLFAGLLGRSAIAIATAADITVQA